MTPDLDALLRDLVGLSSDEVAARMRELPDDVVEAIARSPPPPARVFRRPARDAD